MTKWYRTVLETIGRTPMVRLNRVSQGIKATVLAKVESFNPGGSVKDRIGLTMIEDAERRGLLKPGGTIVEATSGNTGVGLAIAAAVKGYKVIFTIPDKMSKEKIALLKAYGAKVVVTPTAVPPDSPESYYSVAQRIANETPNSFLPSQYFNPKNPEAHYLTTGPEIYEQTDGKITHFICGMGTGGTISGAGRFLKEKDPKIRVIGVDPLGSILRTYFYTRRMDAPQPYRVEGIGEDFVPGTTYFEYIDEIHPVTDKEAFLMTRRLAKEEGLLMGGSSGAAVHVALNVASNLNENDCVVVLLPDTGERYLSKVHSDEWMRENGYMDEGLVLVDSILDRKEPVIPRLVHVGPDTPASTAISLMRRYGISQLPVLADGKPVGSITEITLLQKLSSGEVQRMNVGAFMEPPFPVLDRGTEIMEALPLLEKNHAVLVALEGKIEGIITRIDIISHLFERVNE